ncbi:MAG: response regulator [Magnetospirillum sp. WYHS-4]
MASLFPAQKGKTTAAFIRSLDRTRAFNFGMSRLNLIFGACDDPACRAIEEQLRWRGFSHIRDISAANAIAKALDEALPDLLVCDGDLPGGDVCEQIRRLRNRECGRNPFALVVTLMRSPTADRIRAAIDAGSDDIVILQSPAASLAERIAGLVHKRKPFVVTDDYIGPTRREAPREGSEIVPLVHVPNTAFLKIEKSCPDPEIERLVDRACRVVDGQKLERHAVQVTWRVARIRELVDGAWPGARLEPHLARLDFLAGDIERRLEASAQGHVAEMCRSLARVCGRLLADLATPDPRAIDLLAPLAEGIDRAFRVRPGQRKAAQRIAAEIDLRYGAGSATAS